MNHTAHTNHPTGFTIIELLVAATILSILAVTTIQRFSQTRTTARDGLRKTGVHIINQALESSHAANGTYLITVTGKLCSIANNGTIQNAQTRSGAGCVGANGAGMGLVNLASTQTAPVIVMSTVHTTLSYTYSPVSIISALQQNGYLASAAKDPQSTSTTDPNSPDFSIATFCPGGMQKNAGDGAYAAVYTSLEGSLTSIDAENTANNGGGVNQLPSTDYAVDYGAPSTLFTTNIYSVGTGSPKSGQAMGKKCGDVAMR